MKLVGKRQGFIKGEAQDPEFPGYLALEGWSWGVHASLQGTHASGRAQARSLDFTCAVDSATPALFSALVTNEELKTATIEMRRAGVGKGGQSGGQNFLTITMKKAHVGAVDVVHSAENLIPVVRGSLVFEEVEVNYRAQASHGGSSGGSSSFSWTILDSV